MRGLLTGGLIRNIGQVYWYVRLSESYPTVEVRAVDVQLRPDEVAMLATLVLLAGRAVDAGGGWPPLALVRPETLPAAVWYADRHGCSDQLFDPRSGQPRPTGEVVPALLNPVDRGPRARRDRPATCRARA